MRFLHAIILFLLCTGLAHAGDERAINEQLQNSKTVYLDGTYNLDDQIILNNGNQLIGTSNTILKVHTPFFTGSKSIIKSNGIVNNILVDGFRIDGNCDEFDNSLSSTEGHDHDNEQAIRISGSSDQFCNNITIRNMVIYDCFGDGIHVRFGENVNIYNNEISNTQHEGFYLVNCRNFEVFNNKIAGITSDCGRCANCENGKVYSNLFYSYNGNHNNGAYKNGENGLQIGDDGSSHGYTATGRTINTNNIEVYDNTFADPGLRAIWLDPANKGTENIYIHDNKFVDASVIETDGIPVDDISYENPPSIKQSEKIFSSIFDILDSELSESGRTSQTPEDIPLKIVDQKNGVIAGGIKIVGVRDRIVLDNISYIPDESAVLVQSKVIQNPDLGMWSGVIKQIDKDVNVKIENQTATATMTVKTSWYLMKRNSITGKLEKGKTKSSTVEFTDSYYSVPQILKRNNNTNAKVTVFDDTENPLAKLSINTTNTTQKIEVTYENNNTTQYLMIGERLTGSDGIKYTSYSRCDTWKGNLSHMGNEIIIPGKFNPVNLHIKYFTPYESNEVTDIEVIYHKTKGESQLITTLKFILYLLLAMFAGYKIMDIIIN